MKYLVLFFAMLFATSAQALRVGNCDTEPRTIELDYYGERVEHILQPNQHKRFLGRARELSLGQQTITLIRHNNEYCIRKGIITLQRRGRDTRGFR